LARRAGSLGCGGVALVVSMPDRQGLAGVAAGLVLYRPAPWGILRYLQRANTG